MSNSLKSSLKRYLPAVLNSGPAAVTELLIGRRPHWRPMLRPGRDVKIHDFLGRFTVLVDPLYPIERQMLDGVYDAPTVGLIERFVRPGAVCFDIGANVGAITFALARAAGPGGRVYAFEPGPPTLRRLQRNVSLNPSLKEVVSIHPVGLSDRPGSLLWSEDMENRGNAGLLHESGERVPVVTLDDFCREQGVERVDFIKIDVEGMELEVLRGAESVLRRCRPVLYFETLAAFAEVRGFDIFGEIERLLLGCGYQLFKVDGEAGLRQTTSADLSANTVALPEGRTGEGL